MKKRRIYIAAAFLVVSLLILAVVVQASAPPPIPTYRMVRDVVASGGVVASSDVAISGGEAGASAPYPTGFILHGTLGQTTVGYARSGNNDLVSGFWFWYWRALEIPRRFMPIVFEQYSP